MQTYVYMAWFYKGFKETLSASLSGLTSQASSINHGDYTCSGDGRWTSYAHLHLGKGCLTPGQTVCLLNLLTYILWILRELWRIMRLPGLLCWHLGISDAAEGFWGNSPFEIVYLKARSSNCCWGAAGEHWTPSCVDPAFFSMSKWICKWGT